VTQNLTASAQWYTKAAEGGLAQGQYNLATMYELGEGMKQDYVKASEWYQKSADQGYSQAQISLGTLYHQGKGVAQDLVKAHLWYSLAAKQLEAGTQKDRAVKNRDNVLKHMNPKQIVEAQQMASTWKAK